MNAPLPRSEAQRLAALQDAAILDTPPALFSDSVVALAACIASTPISAVTLVDHDRQWFKGSVGLTVRETPRAHAFCAYSILQAAPLVVPDAWMDYRFARNPLVTGAPHIRFYAGFPLLIDGHAVGALCVIDVSPRHFFEYQENKLVELTRLAAATSTWLANFKARGVSQPRSL